MNPSATRRQFLASLSAGIPALAVPSALARAENEVQPVETATITEGDLKVLLRDNTRSPKILGGIDSLFHLKDAPMFDAFDPDSVGLLSA